jgi:predicted dehydrogenase
VTTTLELESGATVTLITSFEVSDRYVCDLAIHGREGTLLLPDPNFFEGVLRIRRNRGEWEELSYASRGTREARGVGLQDLVEAVADGHPPRASGRLGAHVVDVARSALLSAEEGRTIDIVTRAERPDALPVLNRA